MIARRNSFALGLAALAAGLIGAPASAQTPAPAPSVEAAQIEGFEDCLRIRSGEAFETIAKARGYAPDEDGRWVKQIGEGTFWFRHDSDALSVCSLVVSPANAGHDRLIGAVRAKAPDLKLVETDPETSQDSTVTHGFLPVEDGPMLGIAVRITPSSEALPGGISGVVVVWE